MPVSNSLTVTANGGLLRVLQSQCHVSLAFDPKPGIKDPDRKEFLAIWDTGATASVITDKVITECGLLPTGVTQVHGVHGVELSETFLVSFALPNRVIFPRLTVTKGQLAGADVLIGMDVITKGDFVITNQNGNTVFSFRVPSQCCIDFVKEHNESLRKEKFNHGGSKKGRKKTGKKFGRNK